jgi:outer membrane protein OmpA-like peptidoglycan-associated protein
MWRKTIVAVPLAVVALAGSTACASKKYVNTSVGELGTRVDSLGRSIEETQERTRANEGRITEVDQKATAATQAAQQASTAAQTAGAAAATANTAATAARTAAADVNTRVDTLDRANRRLVYEVVLNSENGNFAFGQSTLPDEVKQKLDGMVQQLKQDPKNVFIEIEGHTDNVGAKDVNERIGLERAEAAKRYLYTQYQIPLHKMNVISYGDEKPVAPNTTREGRAQNRRVVIKVLA